MTYISAKTFRDCTLFVGVRGWKHLQKGIKNVLVPSEEHDKKKPCPYTTATKNVCVPYVKEFFPFISIVKYYYYLKH